jgi:hypothetical protein
MCIVIFSKIKSLQTNHGTRKKRKNKEKNTRKMNSQEKKLWHARFDPVPKTTYSEHL